MTEKGTYKYATVKNVDTKVPGKLISLFREAVLSLVIARNLIIVKTLPGSAGAVANVVDQLNSPMMLGCVAGADTLFIACETDENAVMLSEKLQLMLKS